MKKYIFLVFIATLLSSSVSYAQSGDLSTEISAINDVITFDAAPTNTTLSEVITHIGVNREGGYLYALTNTGGIYKIANGNSIQVTTNAASGGVYGLSYITQSRAGDYYSVPYTYGNGSIRKTTTSGLTTNYGSAAFGQVLATDNSNNLYYGNAGNNSLYILNPSGVITTTDLGQGRNISPLFIDSNDNMFFTAGEVRNNLFKRTPGGSISTYISRPISDRIMYASLDTDNSIYMIMEDTSIIRVLPDGTQTVITARVTIPGGSNGIAMAVYNGKIFLTSTTSNIYTLSSTGSPQFYAKLPSIVQGGNANTPVVQGSNIYTSWELLHRSAMLSGLQWTGNIAQFITPQMYVGTPFANNRNSISGPSVVSSFLMKDATTYSECLQNESYLSYGLGERIEETDILELKAIAKICAQQFYGTYFDAKLYTTREEYIMMLMTLFGEDVSLEGTFTKDGKYISSGPGVESGFENVGATAWYSPYLAYADEIGILSTDEMRWNVARAITDAEAIEMLSLYTSYRMGYTGTDTIMKGMIQTESLRYDLTFVSASDVVVKVQ